MDKNDKLFLVSFSFTAIVFIGGGFHHIFDIRFPQSITVFVSLAQVPVHMTVLLFYLYFLIRGKVYRDIFMEGWVLLNIVWWSFAALVYFSKPFDSF